MPRFSQQSFSKLSTCHIDLQILFFEVIKYHDCTITCGYRNQADQDAAYEAGKSKLKFPNGAHNRLPSNGVDVYFYPIDYKNIKKFYWFAGLVLGIALKLKDEGKITHSIRWGGNWDNDEDLNDQSFFDLCHFQIQD